VSQYRHESAQFRGDRFHSFSAALQNLSILIHKAAFLATRAPITRKTSTVMIQGLPQFGSMGRESMLYPIFTGIPPPTCGTWSILVMIYPQKYQQVSVLILVETLFFNKHTHRSL
jgi:hypothetical protein